jgi:hypothetical protein
VDDKRLISTYRYLTDIEISEPVWNVLVYFDTPVVWNVFESDYIRQHIAKSLKQCKTFKSFIKELDSRLFNEYAGRIQWEITITHYPFNKDNWQQKIDVYDQVKLNFHAFSKYVWSNRKYILENWLDKEAC